MTSKPIPLINLPWDACAIFKSRPNRFLGVVDIIQPKIENDVKIHIHDPGRLNDLLYSGNRVVLKHINNANRKTEWDLIAAKYNNQWMLAHSGFHRKIAEYILKDENISPFGKIVKVKPEVSYGDSRLDFLTIKENGEEIWLEVKGCTLAIDKVALFPDAPTRRGSKHLKTLISIKETGKSAAVFILVFREEAKTLAPHKQIDPEFSSTFYQAMKSGVEIYPIVLSYEHGKICYKNRIPIFNVK